MRAKKEENNETLEIEIKTLVGKICTAVLSSKSAKSPLEQIYEQLVAKNVISEHEIDHFKIDDWYLFGDAPTLKSTTTFEDLVIAFKEKNPSHRLFGLRLTPEKREQLIDLSNKSDDYPGLLVNLYLAMLDRCDSAPEHFTEGTEETFLSTVFTLLSDVYERQEFIVGERDDLFQDESLRELVRSFLLTHMDLRLEETFAMKQKELMRSNFPLFLELLLIKAVDELTLKPEEKALTVTRTTKAHKLREDQRELYISLGTPMEWIRPGLYLGSMLAQEGVLPLIQAQKSSFVLNLDCRFQEAACDKEILGYLSISLADNPDEIILPETFFQGCEAIEEGLKRGKVLVNCMIGSARSVIMVVAYLIKNTDSETLKEKSAEELVAAAFAIVKEVRKCAHIGHQEESLLLFAETVKAKLYEQDETRVFIEELDKTTRAESSLFSSPPLPQEVREAVRRLENTIEAATGSEPTNPRTNNQELLEEKDVELLLNNSRISYIIDKFISLFNKVLDFIAKLWTCADEPRNLSTI